MKVGSLFFYTCRYYSVSSILSPHCRRHFSLQRYSVRTGDKDRCANQVGFSNDNFLKSQIWVFHYYLHLFPCLTVLLPLSCIARKICPDNKVEMTSKRGKRRQTFMSRNRRYAYYVVVTDTNNDLETTNYRDAFSHYQHQTSATIYGINEMGEYTIILSK